MNSRTQVHRTLSIALTGMLALSAVLVMPALAQDYGTGVVIDVPYVAPGTLTMDGNADEAAWDNATTLSIENEDFFWSGGWNNDYGAEPDINYTTKLLYTEDTLYVHVLFEDYQALWFGPEGSPGGGEQILVGIDPVHEAGVSDTLIDDTWGGWVENAPDQGPHTYKITSPDQGGITLNWAAAPVDSGWVNGTVFVDEANFTWGVEMAIYAPQIEQGGQVGFNVGGATAHPDESFEYEEGARDYAWFSWQVEDPENPGSAGGDVMRVAASFATLNLVPGTVAIEETPTAEIPTGFTLEQNYPNPFNPATTIEYGLIRPAQVTLSVYNTLGQRVATLVDGQRPAGAYSVRWEPENLPSGIYLYQLQVDGNTVASRKMMLIK